LVTDGDTVWLYDPLLENVTIQKLTKVTQGTALSFLLGMGNLKSEFNVRAQTRQLYTSAKFKIVEMIPKKMMANIELIQMAVDPKSFDLKAIIFADSQQNYRIIEFLQIQPNIKIDETQFYFKVTPEMEVIQAEY
jgi:outer membrane lipoprotein carrier protein